MWFRYGKIWLKYKKYYWNIKDVIKVQKCDNGIETWNLWYENEK